MNISEIWKLSDDQLQSIMVTKNQSLSDNRNFDRTVVATILYNEGRLDAKSMLLIEHPKFNEIMSKDYNFGIGELTILLHSTTLQKQEVIGNSKDFQLLFIDYFDELGLTDIVFENYYQPSIKMLIDHTGICPVMEFYINNKIVDTLKIGVSEVSIGKIYSINFYDYNDYEPVVKNCMITGINLPYITFFDIKTKTIYAVYLYMIRELPDIIVVALKNYYKI